MTKVILGAAATLFSFSLIAWIGTGLLGIKGVNLWILRAALLFIGLALAAGVAWFLHRRATQKKGSGPEASAVPAGGEGEEIEILVRQAEAKLGSAQLQKGAKIGTLPLILIMGESASTKTTTLLHSGLEPELLAGQLYKEGAVVPTRAANLWFSHRTLFVEGGGGILQNTQSWMHLVKRIAPRKLGALMGSSGQAPRAALVCVDAELVAAGGDPLSTLARNLRARLGDVSQIFDIQLPVYVLFTKTDRIPFFPDFVRNLTTEESTQVLGVTLPSAGGPAAGIYAQEQTSLLNNLFDRLFQSLCNARPEYLSRESDSAKLPGAYEFPREFRKLRTSGVQFLVDLCRPSQLTVGPFLRGFYFSGVRPIIVEESAPAPARRPQQQEQVLNAEATRIFQSNPREAQPASVAPQAVMGTRKVPQWVFLGHLFNDILLADRVGMGASGSSAKTDVLRRVLLSSFAVLCLLFCCIFAFSYFQNRALENQIKDALTGTEMAPGAANLASVESLRRLETLRQSVEKLTTYHNDGPPLSYRWGLYVGEDLYPQARRLYFARFRQQLFGDTQNRLVQFLRDLPTTPGPAYGTTYEDLKAYLITTSHNEKSIRDFLSPVLYKTWSANRTVDPERTQLAQKQFDFYSDELKTANPFTKDNDAAAIEKGRHYLGQFKGFERVYHAMLTDAAKHSEAINFNKKYPGSAEFVTDPTEVTGPFTKDGWTFMQNAMKDLNRYLGPGEQWVLGDQTSVSIDNPTKLADDLGQRYETDYITQWRAYLRGAGVVKYANLKDAADKLTVLSSNSSPLLALFSLASQNTGVNDKVKAAFQPVLAVVPPGDRYLADSNKNYVSSLVVLQTSVDAVAKLPQPDDAGAAATLKDATAARVAARQMTAGSVPDPAGHVDSMVEKLVLDPITNVEELVRGLGPAELNAKGKALCAQFRAVLGKYPFNPSASTEATVAEVNGIFAKPDGALWKFYQESLQKLMVKQGDQYAAKPGGVVSLTPAFVNFFNHSAAFSDAIYAGGSQDPHLNYSLKFVPTEGIESVGLDIDGQAFSSTTPKPIVWQGSGAHGVKATTKLGSTDLQWFKSDGLWAVFHFISKTDHREPTPNGELLEWTIRTSNGPIVLPSGKPLTLRLELNMAGAPPVFQKGFASQFACAGDVAN